jgi:AcrR family transcriptional regulator
VTPAKTPTRRTAPVDRRITGLDLIKILIMRIIDAKCACHAQYSKLSQNSPLLIAATDRYACHMASAPKKKSTSAVAKKTRLNQAEAIIRMLSATSQLLIENVPGEVTVQRICEKAGVHTSYVVRYFGSREELLCQAVEAAFLGVFLNTEAKNSSRLNMVLEGNVDVMELAQARIRTIAYLLGCGVSPERFQPSQKLLLESVFAQSDNPNVLNRTRINLVLMGTLVFQAMGAFAEVNNMTEQQKQDMLSCIGYLSQSGEQVQTALGWDKPKAKKKKQPRLSP